jgi:hypothetical protein
MLRSESRTASNMRKVVRRKPVKHPPVIVGCFGFSSTAKHDAWASGLTTSEDYLIGRHVLGLGLAQVNPFPQLGHYHGVG